MAEGTRESKPNTDSGRRGNDSRRTETVTFPRNEQERGLQSEVNRGRADASEPRVQSNPSPSSLRRTDETRRGVVVAPRNERPQQQEAGRDRNNDFVRAPAEARRESPREPRGGSSQPSEASRRSEPAVRNAPNSAPAATAHPSREQSRGRSAPQSSSSSRQKKEEDSSDSGDRGRGRDGR